MSTCCNFTAAIQATPVPSAPTNLVFASNTAFSFVVAGWDAPPAGVLSTEIWTSSDNITFALNQTVAAPTATGNVAVPAIGSTTYAKIRFVNAAGNGAFTSVLLFTHTDWETRAATASGGDTIIALSKATQNNFYSALANGGILSKMINVGLFVFNTGGANPIQVCMTPIIKTVGTDAWADTGITNGMLDANGVTNSAAAGNGADPGVVGTDFPSDNSGGITVYAYTATNQVSRFAAGYFNNAASIACYLVINSGGAVSAQMWNNTSTIATACPGAGYYSLNRTGAAALDLYFANTTTPHAGIAGSALAAGTRDTHKLSCFSANEFEIPTQFFGPVNNRLRLIAMHAGLTAAESLAFYNIIVAAITFSGNAPV